MPDLKPETLWPQPGVRPLNYTEIYFTLEKFFTLNALKILTSFLMLKCLYCMFFFYFSKVDNHAAALGLDPVGRQLWHQLFGARRHGQAAVEKCLLVLILQVGHELLH